MPVAAQGHRLFYRIKEVSELTGVEPYVLRYWETEFPLLRPRKSRGGQRLYESKDIQLILTIKRMLYEEGYTIAGARRRLLQERRGSSSVKEGLSQIRRDLESLLELLQPSGRGAAR